jgi:hypothetical protein
MDGNPLFGGPQGYAASASEAFRTVSPGDWVNSAGWSAGEALVGDRRAAMGLQRLFYAGGRPNRVARVLDRCTAAMSTRAG